MQILEPKSKPMRENLLFMAFRKRVKIITEELVKQVCVETLELENANTMTFDRVHRMGT